jgi:hypothetical protein
MVRSFGLVALVPTKESIFHKDNRHQSSTNALPRSRRNSRIRERFMRQDRPSHSERRTSHSADPAQPASAMQSTQRRKIISAFGGRPKKPPQTVTEEITQTVTNIFTCMPFPSGVPCTQRVPLSRCAFACRVQTISMCRTRRASTCGPRWSPQNRRRRGDRRRGRGWQH